jgi:hypothetical protein
MITHEHPLEWYTDKLKNLEYFSQGMYGDGEWYAIFHTHIGRHNVEHTSFTKPLCDALEQSLHYSKDNYYFSVPSILSHPSVNIAKDIDKICLLEFVEKDCWDKWTREGTLVPFIKQLQDMKVCIISNKALRGLTFLQYDEFIEISHPNCFGEIDSVMERVKDVGNDCVQKIHSEYKNVFALDLGSIWDAFVGIGGERGWRGEMYADQTIYQQWKDLYKEVL